MSNEDQIIRHYYSLQPTRFPVLVSFELRQIVPTEMSPPEIVIEIELRSEDDNDSRSLKLSFSGVREAKISQPTWSLFTIPFIEICSIRDYQWEGLNYKVKCEEDLISFLCRDFKVIL